MFGDLNFRTENIKMEEAREMINNNNIDKLLEHDQVSFQRAKSHKQLNKWNLLPTLFVLFILLVETLHTRRERVLVVPRAQN